MSVFNGVFGAYFVRPGGRGKGRSHAWMARQKKRADQKLEKNREEIRELDRIAAGAFGKPGDAPKVILRKTERTAP